MSGDMYAFGLGYLALPFDMLSVGDLDLIAQARARCERLVVGVLTDEQIVSAAGRLPVVPLAERLLLVQHLRGPDAVVVHDEEQVPPQAAVFTLAGVDEISDAVPLAVSRVSSSTLLLAAIGPASQGAVA